MIDRQTQIAFIEQTDERMKGYFQKWTSDPEVKAALHRYDVQDDESDDVRVAVG
jgi:hypothetical protein